MEKETRIRILNAIRKKLPNTFAHPDLEMVALDYFRRLGHDNHRRLCRVYGWEEKKSKAAWGGLTVDYEAIAAKAARDMKPDDLQRFLVACALASDLYCPGFNPRQPLSNKSNLARTAVRYKIDTAKLAAQTHGELSKAAETKNRSPRKSKVPKKGHAKKS